MNCTNKLKLFVMEWLDIPAACPYSWLGIRCTGFQGNSLNPTLARTNTQEDVMHQHRRSIFGILLLTFAFTMSGCATNAVTGRSQLMLVSEQSAITQSESAYSSLIAGLNKSGKLSKDEKLIARVQNITDRLISQAVKYRSETRDWKWNVQVIDDPETVNAFCMAGGKMAIYTGLINEVKPTDDEIAQVMGHEISHALASHTAEKMSVQLATGLAVVAITSAANQKNRQSAHTASSLAALTLITLPNSREAESEADRIGIELAAKAGYEPHAAVTLWEKMMKTSGQTSQFDFLSTHPAPPKRIEALAALASKLAPVYEAGKSNRSSPSETWTAVASGSPLNGVAASTKDSKSLPMAFKPTTTRTGKAALNRLRKSRVGPANTRAEKSRKPASP